MRTCGVGCAILAASLLLTACGAGARSSSTSDAQPKADANRKWWETAVIYQIYPRSFKDSDASGIGDLKGIASKLDYLKDLGVGAIWLSPIYPSPQADFGYDISNFKGIDPQYGTMADFDELLKKAHDHGLKIVLDFVPNHTSDEHEWFKKSVKKEGNYTDYYVWANATIMVNGTKAPPNNWISNFKGSAWEWNEERKQYYLHQFAVKQPDLNYKNQNVVDEMKNVIRFWMDKGVDGLRVDAIVGLFEDPLNRNEPQDSDSGETDPTEHGYLSHIYTENLNETYDMVKQWREVLNEYSSGGDRVMMTEAYATLDQTIRYYGTEKEPGASFSFNFYLITSLNAASKATDFKKTIDDWMSQMNDFRKPNWVIGNHDKSRVGSFYRYGAELADGINMISLMLPGTAMTYNGEEIGMDNTFITWEQTKDTQALSEGPKKYLTHSRDLQRTPFQWDSSTSAGFSKSKSTWLPVNPDYWRVNAKAQQEAEHSHLKMYKALLKARKMPAVQGSSYATKTIEDVLIISREMDGQDGFYVLVNLGSEETDVKISDLRESLTELNVWTSSVNSERRPGDLIKSKLTLRPKEGLVLTKASVPSGNSASNSKQIGIFLSILMPLLCLRM